MKLKSFPYQQNCDLSGSPSFKGIESPKLGENRHEIVPGAKYGNPMGPRTRSGTSYKTLRQSPDLLLRIMLKCSGLLFGNHQSSRLCHLQDTVRSPELLHLRQEISGSKRWRQTPVCCQGAGPPLGSECCSGLSGTPDSRITGAMSCLGKSC